LENCWTQWADFIFDFSDCVCYVIDGGRADGEANSDRRDLPTFSESVPGLGFLAVATRHHGPEVDPLWPEVYLMLSLPVPVAIARRTLMLLAIANVI
jgi:hypothetical protein